MSGAALFLLGGTAAFAAAILLVMELSFVWRPGTRVTLARCILASQLLAACVVLPTLLLTGHPWGRGIGVLAYLFLLPPSLTAALTVRLLYRAGTSPILGRTATVAILLLLAAISGTWLALRLPGFVTEVRARHAAEGRNRYSDRERAEARAALERYREQGLVLEYHTSAAPAAIRVDGVRWMGQSREAREAVFRSCVRAFATLGFPTSVALVDDATEAVYAQNDPREGFEVR